MSYIILWLHGDVVNLVTWYWHLTNAVLVSFLYSIQNLELLQEYGSTVWKGSNEILVRLLNTAQEQLQDIRKKIQDINWQRKNEQIEAGTKLKTLEDR